MAVIGEFATNGNNSIAGYVRTLTVGFKARLNPIERVSRDAPDFRITAGNGVEVGAGWTATSDDGEEYISVKMDEAYERYWEACEAGSINQYRTIRCTECGHEEGDLPDDSHDYDSAHDAEFEALETAACLQPEIVNCYSMSGDSDYLFQVTVKGIEEYERFLKKTLLHLPGVASVSSKFVLKKIKNTTKLPI